jgi:hypothetical protein
MNARYGTPHETPADSTAHPVLGVQTDIRGGLGHGHLGHSVAAEATLPPGSW